ncbi:helix-turn-helix transcriptional regulator [Lentilactobacillus senioris]|uniref:helix-turn-helix domain-containing protein n=1 Tax=Lentilactobacillus senioris TaxID=931534 RepID=UPI0022827230|nr:helix-turn-helix transcriptional regulator [Lentilactobacillus senioris]MCY9806526.1 helix-turn-helix transcriptional regulator [Lentilactobacillus senioris]
MEIPLVKENAGEILRIEREKRGLSQVSLASKMGLKSSQHLWNIEHGANSLTLEMIDQASKALGISPDIFLRNKVKQNI